MMKIKRYLGHDKDERYLNHDEDEEIFSTRLVKAE